MIELMDDLAGNVVAARAHGDITRDDYVSVLVPATDAALSEHRKVRILYLVEDGATFSPGAMLEDAFFGMRHLFEWERIALVTDIEWLSKAMNMLQVLMPCPARLFSKAELDDAKDWIQS